MSVHVCIMWWYDYGSKM